MRTSTARLALVIAIFVVAMAGGLLLMQQSRSSGSDGGSKQASAGEKTATSDVWKVGDNWTVNVNQDAGAVTPGGETSVASIPFRFRVDEAPTGEDGWIVKVTQDGAEGPFAGGWRLEYVERGETMRLNRVAAGMEPWLEAELASIVLGPQFPYEVSYSAPPRDSTVNADALLDRSELPPGALPNGDPAVPDGVAPPAEAPKVSPGGAPAAR